MYPHRQNYLNVFVVRDIKTHGIIQDDIIEIKEGKFKSIKFRHTFYRAGDFVLTSDEALEVLVNKEKTA